MDSTIVEVHGRAKQGAAFGYNKVRGYPPQLTTSAQPGQVLMSRLRDAALFLTETISRVRRGGGTGQLIVRADSAFYSGRVISTAAKFDVRFVVLDPLAAFLVVLRRHWGVALAVAVLTTDAVANGWADYVPLSSPEWQLDAWDRASSRSWPSARAHSRLACGKPQRQPRGGSPPLPG